MFVGEGDAKVELNPQQDLPDSSRQHARIINWRYFEDRLISPDIEVIKLQGVLRRRPATQN
ncbi:hypothetical protein HID58_018557, partial [Brassica napus]